MKKNILIVIFFILSIFIYIMYFPPSFILEYIKNETENQIIKNTNLYTKIDRISRLKFGIFEQKAIAENITILKGNNYKKDIFISSKKLEINFNLISLLFNKLDSLKININFIDPNINLKRFKNGKFDIDSPLFDIGEKEKKEKKDIVLPSINLLVKNASINYEDYTFKDKFKLDTNIKYIKLKVVEGAKIFYDTDIKDDLISLKLNGFFHLNDNSTDNGFQIKINNISKIVNTFVDLKKYDTYISQGNLNISGYLSFDNLDFKNLKIKSDILLNNFIAKNKKFDAPVIINKLNLNLTQDTANLKELNLSTLGSNLNLNLNSNFSEKVNFFKANFLGKSILLEKILKSLKIDIPANSEINTNLSLEGNFKNFKNYNQFIKYPTNINLIKANSYFEANNLKYQNINTDKFSFNINLDKNSIFIDKINSNILDGNINGNIKISNFKDFNIKNSNIDGKFFINKIEPYKYFSTPRFSLNSLILLSGKTINPKLNANINIPSIDNFKNININSNIFYHDKNILGNIKSKSIYGFNNIDFNLNNFDSLYIKANLNKLPVNIINNFNNYIKFDSGYLYADTETSIDISKIDTSNILNNNIILKSNINLVNSTLKFDNNKLSNLNLNIKTNILDNNSISNIIDINSNELGNIYNSILLKDKKNIDLKIDIEKLPLKIINSFYKKISFSKGYLNSNIDLKTNLNDIKNKNFNKLNIKSFVDIKDTNFNYDKLDINNLNSNLIVNSDKNNLDTKLFLKSRELEVNSNIKLIDNNLKGNLNINDLNAKYFNLLENINIKNAFIDINSNFNTNINDILNKLNFRANINMNNLISYIKIKDKNFSLNIPNYKSNINYKNGYLISNNKLISNFIKQANLNFNLNPKGFINGNLDINSLDLKKVNFFIDKEDYQIKNSILDTKLNFNLNYKNLNSLKINGNSKIKDLKINYFNSLYKKTDYKNYLNDISSKRNNINSNDFDLINIDFSLKDNKVNISNLEIRKNKSNIKGNLDINLDNLKGKILLKSNNINFRDFKIFRIYGINKGNFKNLYISSSLDTDYKNLFSQVFFSVENMNENATVSGDIQLQKNLLRINNILLKENNNFLDLSGKLNLSNDDIDLSLNSKDFSIKDLISLVPEKYINSQKDLNFKGLNIVYTLPNKKTDTINFENLLKYWEKNYLEPNDRVKDNTNNIDLISSLDGKLSIECTTKGKLYNPLIDIELLINDLKIYRREISEIYLYSSINKDKVNLEKAFLLDKDGGYLELNGIYDKGKIDFRTNGKLNLSLIDDLSSKRMDLEGFHFVDLDIKGNINNPLVNLNFYTQDGGSFNKVYFDDFSINADLKDKLIDLKLAKITSIGKEVKANGFIPLDENSDKMNISTLIKDNNLEIINLFTNKLDWDKGRGDIFLNIQGNPYKPLITGKVNIFDSKVFLSSLGGFLDDLTLNIDINNNFIKINKANALFNDKPIDIIGQIDLVNYIPTNLKLKFFADELKWQENGINLTAKTSLSITNTIDEPVIGGKVLLKKGEINFSLGGSSSSSKSSSKSSKSSSFISYNNLDIEIDKNTDFWVKSPFFEMRPFGDLKLVSGDLYNPIILGNIEIDKGNIFIINNEFNILSAKAVFGGKQFEKDLFPLNPELTFIANTRLINPKTRESTLVEAKINAELEDIPKNNVKFEWTNKGGLKDEEIWTQIIGLTAAQQIIEETGSGNTANTIAEFATPYLSRALFNPLTSKVADLFSLDEFNVGLASDTITNPGVAISISKPLLWGLSIGYDGIIRASNEAQYDFFVRYKLNRNLSLKANIDERQALSIQGEIGSSF